MEDGNIRVTSSGTGHLEKHLSGTWRRLLSLLKGGKSLPIREHNCAHTVLHIGVWQRALNPDIVALARSKNETLRTLSDDDDHCLQLG
jgi:hypothetical protein